MRYRWWLMAMTLCGLIVLAGCGGSQSTAPTGVIVTPNAPQPKVAGSPVATTAASGKIGEAERAAAQAPEDAETAFQLGNAYAEAGRYPEAEQAYSRAVELNPEHVDASSNLGVIYYKQGRLADAEALFRTILAANPDDAEIRYNLGGALAAQNKLDEAAREFEKAREAQPDLAQPYLGLGTVYQAQGKKAEAIEALRKYVELSQDPTWREQAKQMLRDLGAE